MPTSSGAVLKFLAEHVLTDRPFRFSPKLLRRLASDRWLHWGNERTMLTPVEYPIHERVLSIQQVVLEHTLDGATLRRVQNNALKHDGGQVRPLQISEVFRGLTDAVWLSPVVPGANGKKTAELSVVQRNLQREHLRSLTGLVLKGGDAPPEVRSLARLHLKEIGGRIDRLIADKAVVLDDTSRAHLEESRERITRTLGASVQVTEP